LLHSWLWQIRRPTINTVKSFKTHSILIVVTSRPSTLYWACSEIRSRVLRSATVPFFYDKKNGTVALRSTLERISEHAHVHYPSQHWSLPFPLTTIFTQMTSSSSLSTHSILTQESLTFKTLFNTSLAWLLQFFLLFYSYDHKFSSLVFNFKLVWNTLHAVTVALPTYESHFVPKLTNFRWDEAGRIAHPGFPRAVCYAPLI